VYNVLIDARFVQVIETSDVAVLGVTSVDDELFVLLNRDDNQVAVYNINDYKPQRHLHLPGFKPCYYMYSDMTSCVRNKCLYISDPINSSIQRFELTVKVNTIMKRIATKHISKWSVPGSPRGLSITPSYNLLVACCSPTSKLVELSADSGQCVREITLQADIKNLCHAVQLTTGQFVVCHGGENDPLHRVCLVDDDGKVTRSYGGQRGRGVGQLYWPSHLAVDEDSQFIFVDEQSSFSHKVVLLSPKLKFVRYFSEGLSRPQRLYFHHSTRRLYVGQLFSGVTAIQL